MNNLSGHLNFSSSDSHFGRNKRKKDTGSDAHENGFDALHLHKKRCLGIGISSHPNDHQYVDDVDMSDKTGTFQVAGGNSNTNNSTSNTSMQYKHERHEVRSFCRPHWKEDLYEFGPFF